jgi:predicted hotdog family 3-hydroxylacyl-ACP dehydratase
MDQESPWYKAKEELKTVVPAPPFTALIANLTPHRESIRLGVLINGRESSITVPFDLATQFLDQVQTLIKEKGAR